MTTWLTFGGMQAIGNTFEKTGVTGWNASVYSQEGYSTDVQLEFKSGTLDKQYRVSLNESQGSSGLETDLDYTFRVGDDATASVFVKNTFKANVGAYTTDTEFKIIHNATSNEVLFLMDGAVVFTEPVADGLTMYVDSAFYDPNGVVRRLVYKEITALDAPINPVVNLVGYTFGFEPNHLVAITDHEFTTDNEATYSDCTTNSFNVPSQYIKPGHVKVRVKTSTNTLDSPLSFPNPSPSAGTIDTNLIQVSGQSNTGQDPTEGNVVPDDKYRAFDGADLIDYEDSTNLKNTALNEFLFQKAQCCVDHYTVCRFSVGGTSLLPSQNSEVDNWGDEGTLRVQAANQLKNAIMAIENEGVYNIVNREILWVQGEQDTNYIETGYNGYIGDNYRDAEIGIFNYWVSENSIDRMMVVKLSGQIDGGNPTGYALVNQAKIDSTTATANLELLNLDTSAFVPNDMYDNIHWATIGGQTQVGTQYSAQFSSTPNAPVITDENNDTNTFAWTAVGDVEMNIAQAGWNDVVSPFVVGYNDYAIGDIELRVKAVGVHPASSTVSNTTAFTEAPEVHKTTVKINCLGSSLVRVCLLSPVVVYKGEAYISSQVETKVPDIDGAVSFDLVETENMAGNQFYLIDMGAGVRFKFKVPKQDVVRFKDVKKVRLP